MRCSGNIAAPLRHHRTTITTHHTARGRCTAHCTHTRGYGARDQNRRPRPGCHPARTPGRHGAQHQHQGWWSRQGRPHDNHHNTRSARRTATHARGPLINPKQPSPGGKTPEALPAGVEPHVQRAPKSGPKNSTGAQASTLNSKVDSSTVVPTHVQ